VVQRQLEAYNAHDVEAWLATYADDARQFEHPAKPLANGKDEIRERIAVRFREPNLHARLIHRAVLGEMVIDHEEVTRTFPEGTGRMEMVAIYEVRGGRIANAWFRFGAPKLDAPPARR
jgi:hypothetical protein